MYSISKVARITQNSYDKNQDSKKKLGCINTINDN